jgi:dienelactone hydrolase
MISRMQILLTILLVTLWCTSGLSRAELPDDNTLGPQLNEQILRVPVGGDHPVMLQVTVFKPDGPGPFPVAILNHGKDFGEPRDAPRYRSPYAVHYFVSRGYAAILPMMRGFAGSGGDTWVRGCNIENMGTEQARDIRDVIQYLPQSEIGSWLDMSRVIVSGQSLGGWNTLAAGALKIPGVKGLVNFAGGIQTPDCSGWRDQLYSAAGRYGKTTLIPSLWFYGDNDSKFSPTVWQTMKDRYTRTGGQVEMVAYGPFMKDSHNFLGKVEALPIWVPQLDTFLTRLGLPNQNLHPELLPHSYPAATHVAAIDDITAVPLVNELGRKDYQAFLTKEMPRVFAIASDGASFSTNGGYDPLERAQALCKKYNRRCQIYAVDDEVVWPKPLAAPPATQFAKLEDAAAVPYLSGCESAARL